MINQTLTAGDNKVTFKSFGVDLVGNLYLPEGFDENKKYKTIVSASPFPAYSRDFGGSDVHFGTPHFKREKMGLPDR